MRKKKQDVPDVLPEPEKDPEPVELKFPEALNRRKNHSSVWILIVILFILLAILFYFLSAQYL